MVFLFYILYYIAIKLDKGKGELSIKNKQLTQEIINLMQRACFLEKIPQMR
jgi:hypothetical protein